MHHSAVRGMRRRRRRRSIFEGLGFSAVGARGSPTLRYCTGFLLLSSVVICHVTLVRYVDERFRPETGDGGSLEVEVERSGEEGRWNHGRRLMSKEGEVRGLDDRGPGSQPKNDAKSFRSGQQTICRGRHIQGVGSLCDPLPCLRTLQGSVRDLHPASQISADLLRRLNRIPGSLDPVHYTLFPFLSDMQRSKGVHGSVGQIGGVHLGQFAALLSLSVDRPSGEGFLVSDPFNSSMEHLPGLSQFDIFRSHLNDFHSDVDSHSTDNRLHIHRGRPSPHLASVLLQWDFPRFRLISVEATSLRGSDPLEGLELAACLLRDGGIIVLDHPSSIEAALSTAAAFLERHGKSAISPIFAAGNKLFMTTTNWKTVYGDHFRRKETSQSHLSVVDGVNGYHGDKIFVVR